MLIALPQSLLLLHTDAAILDHLLRKLAPETANATASHSDLVRALQSCSDCAMRSTFCSTCAKKADQFFLQYSSQELLLRYGCDLPPPNAEIVESYADQVAQHLRH